MHQKVRKSTLARARGGHGAPRRTSWPRCILYPALALGAVMMVMALKVGYVHATAGHSWQKVRPAPGFDTYSAFHSPKWEKPCTTLTGDNDDDDDGNDDDCPTT